ncbi:MAG: hypothetical protein K1X92_02600 [Bacteroidia bacterium]|nr:hypothetical protein [Bacteroidia bacterium]
MKNLFFVLACVAVLGCTKVKESGNATGNVTSGLDLSIPENEAEEKAKPFETTAKAPSAVADYSEPASVAAGTNESEKNAVVVEIPEANEPKGVKLEEILWDNSPVGQLLNRTMKKSETFTFTPSATENISFQAKEGTVFTIAPHSFLDQNGNPVVSPITLEVKECYKMADILLSNLTTSCGEMPIETAGMFYLNASADGKPVILKKTHPILIEMPSEKEIQKKMQLFYGEKLPVSGVMNWRVAPKETNLNPQNNVIYNVSRREEFKDYEKRFDLGSVELEFTIKTDPLDVLQEPEITMSVVGINPILAKYKPGIERNLDRLTWTEKAFATATSTLLFNPFQKEMGLGQSIFTDIEALLKIKEEIRIYKNVTVRKTMPLVARMNKDFYYVRTNLAGDYAFNLVEWEKDMRFFTSNFQVIKEKGDDYLSAMVEAFNINKDKLIEGYQAKYAYSYIFATNQLGWGNCDQFFSFPQGPPLFVQSDNMQETDVKVILKNRRVVLPMMNSGKFFSLSNTPLNAEFLVVGTRNVNGNPQFCFKEITTGKDNSIQLNDFKPYTFGELQDRLEAFQTM